MMRPELDYPEPHGPAPAPEVGPVLIVVATLVAALLFGLGVLVGAVLL